MSIEGIGGSFESGKISLTGGSPFSPLEEENKINFPGVWQEAEKASLEKSDPHLALQQAMYAVPALGELMQQLPSSDLDTAAVANALVQARKEGIITSRSL